MNEDCIFCKIVSKKAGAVTVFEDEHSLAFLDIHPLNPGHTLVVPKKHYPSMVDMPPEEFAAAHRDLFDRNYALGEKLLASGLIWPALEFCLKCSHLFNILDSSGSVGVTERTAYILRVRQLAVKIARAYVDATTPSAVSEG